MRAEADVSKMAASGQQMWIEHKGQEAVFPLSMFKKNFFEPQQETFQHINQYWAQLPIELQDRIFELYASISEDFDSMLSSEMLKERLVTKVAQLLDLHKLSDIEEWVRFKSDIRVPASFNEEYVENVDKNTTPDKTYTVSQYVQLIALALALRVMVPIWGSYIKKIRAQVGNDFKESSAFLLMRNSQLYSSEAMNKLFRYIKAQIGKDAFNAANTLSFISSEDFPHWLLALVCVKSLCVGDVRSREPNTNLASLVYNKIIQRVMYGESDYTNVVKSKKADDFGVEGDSKISNLERFKTSASISLGQIVEMEFSLRDIFQATVKLCPDIEPGLLHRSLQTSAELEHTRITMPQMTLLRWVFSPIIPPRGMAYMPLPVIISCLGALEAILWTRGHQYLALLSTSYAIIDDAVHRVAHTASKMRPQEDLTEGIKKYFPYTQAHQRNSTVTEVCLVTNSINNLASEIAKCTWRMTADEKLIKEALNTTARRLPSIPNVRDEITRLVIELGRTPKN